MPETITIAEIKNLIKEEGIKPSELFGVELLTDDPVVKGFVEETVKSKIAGEYSHRKREEEAFDKKKADWEKKEQEHQEEIKKLQIENAKTKIGGLFEKAKKERELDTKQSKFIESRLDKFEPEKVEDLEKEFEGHLDKEIDEFNKIAKDVFGMKEEKKEEKKGGAESEEREEGEENPFIKED